MESRSIHVRSRTRAGSGRSLSPGALGRLVALTALAGAGCRTTVATPEFGAAVGNSASIDASEAEAVDGLAKLAWMAGSWRTASGTEELWMRPRGGLMLGLNRTLREGAERAGFEYLRIVREPEGIVLHASPSGGPAVAFRLELVEGTRAVFANPDHDFPKLIDYCREGDVLIATIGADEPGPSWRYERVGPPW